MMDDIKSVVIVHWDDDGDVTYHVTGGGETRLFIIDERAPHDRVFEWLPRAPVERVADLIGDSPIGSSQDDRHNSILHKIAAAHDGRRHLSLVTEEARK